MDTQLEDSQVDDESLKLMGWSVPSCRPQATPQAHAVLQQQQPPAEMVATMQQQQPPAEMLHAPPPAAMQQQQPPAEMPRGPPPAAMQQQQPPAEMPPPAAMQQQQPPAEMPRGPPPAAMQQQQPPAEMPRGPPPAAMRQQPPMPPDPLQMQQQQQQHGPVPTLPAQSSKPQQFLQVPQQQLQQQNGPVPTLPAQSSKPQQFLQLPQQQLQPAKADDAAAYSRRAAANLIKRLMQNPSRMASMPSLEKMVFDESKKPELITMLVDGNGSLEKVNANLQFLEESGRGQIERKKALRYTKKQMQDMYGDEAAAVMKHKDQAGLVEEDENNPNGFVYLVSAKEDEEEKFQRSSTSIF